METHIEAGGYPEYDTLLFDLERLKSSGEIWPVAQSYLKGDFKTVLNSQTSQWLFVKLQQSLVGDDDSRKETLFDDEHKEISSALYFLTALTCFAAFVQLNVTGPPADFGAYVLDALGDERQAVELHRRCLQSLEVDGVSIYQYAPGIELFCLARLILTRYFPRVEGDAPWARLRVLVFHQRLLSGLPGGRLGDCTLLQEKIEQDVAAVDAAVLTAGSAWSRREQTIWCLERAQVAVLLGKQKDAQESVERAAAVSGLTYVLSGALGKRTKWQHKDTSQLVVLARSRDENFKEQGEVEKKSAVSAPEALDLNDDTLLESIAFTKKEDGEDAENLPVGLQDIKPDEQPQLSAMDQIILLTDATLKDTFLPLDKLNSEEILPFAVRVLSDKPTNWQIYTQALLVRSRIEAHRSRTQERSILQLQVIVDQIIVETGQEVPSSSSSGIPIIQVSQFLPRAKTSESAPVMERLEYACSLGAPTRFEIETELAFAWSGVGSLVSALEIFKRLRLWAEVSLCYHSVGQEDKARQVVRRQLFYSTLGPERDLYAIDAPEVENEKWQGDIRSPPPAHAPRLWCILGDLDQDPACWQRAWEVSKQRFARAQRTLGEYHARRGDLSSAREAYMMATTVNRQNNESWSRLGDIDLKTGNWDGAIVAFQQSIMIDDTDAKTYSNLGTAFLAKYEEALEARKSEKHIDCLADDDEETEKVLTHATTEDLLHKSLLAFKRGASLAHSNWKIWDNVITIAFRMTPPSFTNILMGARAILRLRSESLGENAVDIDVLQALVMEVTSRERPVAPSSTGQDDTTTGIYTPPRGTLAAALLTMFEQDIVPLITKRADLWMLVEKMALYRLDYRGALEAAEKAWRALYTGNGEGWMQEQPQWLQVVQATERLVGAYENYGEREAGDGTGLVQKAWQSKARSAVRGVMARGRDSWQDAEGWDVLEALMAGLE